MLPATPTPAVLGAPKKRRRRTRHGVTVPVTQVKLRGFRAIDKRTAAARQALAFKDDLISALGGAADLSPQKQKLVELATRATLLLDHIDAWILGQQFLIYTKSKTLIPVVLQRQSIAEHLAKLLDRLGLDRVPRKVMPLAEYLAQAGNGNGPGETSWKPSSASPSSKAKAPAPPLEPETLDVATLPTQDSK